MKDVPSPCPPRSTSLILKLLVFHGSLMLMCLHGSSLDWRGKLVLVDYYLPLETQKNLGWKGPPHPNPCSRQGCLHRTCPVEDENLQGQRSTVLSKLRLLWFHSRYKEFSHYGLPEFPLLQLFFPVINIFSSIISPIDRKSCFVSFL